MSSVRVWALALLIGLLGVSAPTGGANPLDAPGGAWIAVSGTVLSIDRRHQVLVLRHGPLETAPGGIVVCMLANGRVLVGLQRGDRIDGLARTDRHPWLLRDARILSRPGTAQAVFASRRAQGDERRT
jgi:hypothetical protein